MLIAKNKRFRSKDYRDYVKQHLCCHCLRPSDDAHHINGVEGVMSGKISDLLCIPLCRECHSKIHSGDLEIDQFKEVSKMINLASNNEVLQIKVKSC